MAAIRIEFEAIGGNAVVIVPSRIEQLRDPDSRSLSLLVVISERAISPGTYRIVMDTVPDPIVQVVDSTPPAAPTMTSAPTMMDPTPTLTWTSISDAVSYGLKICATDCNTDCTAPVKPTEPTFEVVTPLVSGNYSVCISATDEAGNSSEFTRNAFSVTRPPAPTVFPDRNLNVVPEWDIFINWTSNFDAVTTSEYKVCDTASCDSSCGDTIQNAVSPVKFLRFTSGYACARVVTADGAKSDWSASARISRQPFDATGGKLSLSYLSTCVLKSGVAWCWGGNGLPQSSYGIGTVGNGYNPMTSMGLTGVQQLAGATNYNAGHIRCVLVGGGVQCTGTNTSGASVLARLGNNTAIGSLGWVPVTGLTSGVTAIATGTFHACAILADKSVKCWGTNTSGQLGNNTTFTYLTPDVVITSPTGPVALTGAVQIIAGLSHTCALMEDTTVKCWGSRQYGQLGDNIALPALTTAKSLIPVAVQAATGGALTGVQSLSLAMGTNHTCAVKTDATVVCWGRNHVGQLGIGSIADASLATGVANLETVNKVVAGIDTTCALLTNGTAKCWGGNGSGVLGITAATAQAPFVNIPTPVTVLGSAVITEIGAPVTHNCAILSTGQIKCWGRPVSMPVLPDFRPTPIKIYGLSNVELLAAGFGNVCVRDTTKAVKCWGDDASGQLGRNATYGPTDPVVQLRPATVSAFYNATNLGPGTANCAVVNGTARCQGLNANGQLTDGTTVNSQTAKVFSTSSGELTNVVQVTAGSDHICARRSDGSVYCAGNNAYGQLGINSSVASNKAVQIAGTFQDVQASLLYTCGLSGTQVWCWGYNGFGQLGIGTTASKLVPTLVTLPPAKALSVSRNAVCALLTDGGVSCWGSLVPGTQGSDFTSGLSPSPLAITLGQSATAVANGGNGSACALLADTTVQCWGQNSWGDLGNGNSDGYGYTLQPTTVIGLTGVQAIASAWYVNCALLSDKSVKCWGRSGGIMNSTVLNAAGVLPAELVAPFRPYTIPAATGAL